MTTPPISQRRLAANRANAQKSTGPRTAEGKRRVAQNACRHNLYAKLHHLPKEIADLLYRRALEETADIADPRFRALFVHRLMLRGHERRLLQLEGKLWAEALRVNNGIVPYASLWIRENHAEVIQALGRYHAWICVRIRAIQKSIFPYILGDEAHQTGIPARTHALLASAAGSSRPITLVACAGAAFSLDHLSASIELGNTTPSASLDQASSVDPAISTHGNLPPARGLSSLLSARGGFRPVRPVPAPQAVKAIRPPTVPGLSLRFLNKSRKSPKAHEPAHARPVPARNHQPTPEQVPKCQRRATTASHREPYTQRSTDTNQPAQSTLHERTKPTLVRNPSRVLPRVSHAPLCPVPERKRRAISESHREPCTQRSTDTNQPAQSTLHERTKPTHPAVANPSTQPARPVHQRIQPRAP